MKKLLFLLFVVLSTTANASMLLDDDSRIQAYKSILVDCKDYRIHNFDNVDKIQLDEVSDRILPPHFTLLRVQDTAPTPLAKEVSIGLSCFINVSRIPQPMYLAKSA